MSINNLKTKNWLFLATLLILTLLIVSLSRDILDLLGTNDRFTNAEQEVQKLENQNLALKAEIDKNNQSLTTETIIRDELGLAKPGDIVVIIPEELLQNRIKNNNQEDLNTNIPNWQKWAQVFGF